MPSRTDQLGWKLASLTYHHFSAAATTEVDRALFAYLGNSLPGAVVVDCGCGPGHMAKLFLEKGAARVYAIDIVDKMLDRVPSHNRIVKVRADLRQGVPRHQSPRQDGRWAERRGQLAPASLEGVRRFAAPPAHRHH